MSATAMMKAKVVNVRVEHDATGMYVATSPDLKGLLVAKQSLVDLHRDIPRAIYELFAVCGVEVVVTPVEHESEFEHPWVAVPKAAMSAAGTSALGGIR